MVARSVSGSGSGRVSLGKAKQHFFKNLDLNCVITPTDERPNAFTATKLVCALGPSSHSVEVLESMLNAGMVGARIDLTWGGLDFHRESLRALNVAMTRTKKLCAVIIDTLGREVMVRRPCVFGPDGWPAHLDPLEITAGQHITLTTRQDVEATDTILPVTYPQLHNMVEPGDTIYIGRYLVCGSDSASLYLEVLEVDDQDIKCEAKNGAVMDGLMTVFHMERSSNSLLNLQNTLPLFCDYDKEALAVLGSEFEIDFVSLAYTRTREDVKEAREFLDGLGLQQCRVLAKIETRQSLLNFRGILAISDGIIVSRGNIGLDVAPEKMALVQKQLISNCNLLGKPVLITRVVDSMVTNPRPTRAEATDIANAVLDGVDGILLGAETLRGAYPVESVATIATICRTAEAVFDYSNHYDHLMEAAQEMGQVVKSAARAAAAESGPGRGNGVHKSVNFAGGSDDDDMTQSEVMSEDMADVPQHTGQLGQAGSGSFSNLQDLERTTTFSSLQAAYQEVQAFAKYGGGYGGKSVAGFTTVNKGSSGSMSDRYTSGSHDVLPFLSKLESLAGSAVRAAGKVEADLIVVYTATGRTAQLVAKYRPPMPIVTLVVPKLINDGIRWKLEGRSTARACQLTRGLLPMLATPGPNGDAVLESAIVAAAAAGLLAPRHHVVVLQQIHEDFCVKIMSLDASGRHVAGSHLANPSRTGSRALSGDYIGRKMVHSSTGALVDSEGEDGGEADGWDEEPMIAGLGSLLCANGSLCVSPSVSYGRPGKPAVAVPPAAAGGAVVGSGVSPGTPSQLADILAQAEA